MDPTTILQLIQEAQLNTSLIAEQLCYLISKPWFDNMILSLSEGRMPDITIVNSDIILKNNGSVLKYSPIDHMWNKILKPDLEQGVDYIYIGAETQREISKHFKCELIPRQMILIDNQPTPDIELKQLSVVVVYPTNLNKYKNNGNGKLIKGVQYVSEHANLKQYIDLLQQSILALDNGVKYQSKKAVSLFKYSHSIKQLEETMKQQIGPLDKYTSPILEDNEFEYLNPKSYSTISDCKIDKNQLIIIEFKEQSKQWIIQHDHNLGELLCPGCFIYSMHEIKCQCQSVSYCNQSCQQLDFDNHQQNCKRQNLSDDETLKQLIQGNENQKKGLVGLRNTGGFCYGVTALQCLLNTTVLREYLLSGEYKLHINQNANNRSKGRVVEKMASLFIKMWYGSKSQLAAHSLKEAIGICYFDYAKIQMNDTAEFLMRMLEVLDQDLNTKHGQIINEITINQDQVDVIESYWNSLQVQNNSIILNEFTGIIKNTYYCQTCKQQSSKLEICTIITLSIPDKDNITLDDCLEYSKQPQTTTKLCEQCQQHIMHCQEVVKMPNVLILQIRRFKYENMEIKTKNNALIQFPFQLVMQNQQKYDLYAVANHKGILDGGHYTANVFNSYFQVWYNFDDDHMEIIPNKQLVISQDAYILFYSIY